MTSKTITSVALTALTTASLLLNARADITTGLVGYWTFDDGSGSSTAQDFSDNGNVGTLTGFSDNSFTSMWVPGEINDGILFNTNGDTGDYVSIPNASDLNFVGPNFTLSAWVYLSEPGTSEPVGARILTKGPNGAGPVLGDCWDLEITTGGKFMFQWRNAAGSAIGTDTASAPALANTWYHVVGVYNRTSYVPNTVDILYTNGVVAASGGSFKTTLFANTSPVTIGNGQNSTSDPTYNLGFQGIIDDVHLYNRGLAPADVAQLYANSTYAAYAPVISTQPRNVTCYVGDNPAFGVGVTGLTPVNYQWQFDGTNIAGATASVLILTNVPATNAGSYSVTVYNLLGTTNSSSAMLTLQSLPAPNTNNGLVGWWRFNDGSGSSTAADSSGNGNAGTLSGFTDGTYTSMWTNGLFNGALAFNGDATKLDVVAVPNVGVAAPAILDFSTNGATGNPVFSLVAWVNGGATQTSGAGIIAKGTNSGGEQYVLEIAGGDYAFYVRDTNKVVYTVQTAIPPDGGWQQLVAVMNATNGLMSLYVNGAFAAGAVAPYSLVTNGQPLSIGNRQSATGVYGLDYTGIMEDVRVYNRNLSSADITALYDATPAPIAITGPLPLNLLLGTSSTLSATASGGVPPYTYQWQRNSTNLPGATSNSLALNFVGPALAGPYDLIVSNSPYVAAATSSVVAVTIVSNITFNNTGVSWMAQGSSPPWWLGNNVLQLTANTASEFNSAFYDNSPVQIGQFIGSFVYQNVTGGTGGADGITFCIQNDPRGPAALGSGGADLGVGPGPESTITPSVEFEFNIYSGNTTGGVGVGVSFNTNGAIGPTVSTSPIANIGNGDIIETAFSYALNVFTVTLTDSNTSAQVTISSNINIPAVLGTNVAWIGFTGGTGGSTATEQVDNFSFQSLINVPPSIVAPPQSITNLPAGLTATYSISVFGSAPFSYQWQLNGTNLNNGPSFTGSGAIVSGANTNTLTIAGVETADAGTYSVVVTNGNLPNAFTSATLTVSNAPTIESQTSTNIEAFAGYNPPLIMSVAGLGPFQYQWTSNGTPIAGATGSSYTPIGALGSTTYSGTVSNAYGTNSISPITVTLLADPTAPYPLAVLASHPMDYWRLDEASGTVGYDYVGGNNGIYTNVNLNNGGYTGNFNPQSDPTETAAAFGSVASNSYMGSVPTLVNFGTPTNSSAEFSVEAWVDPFGSLPSGAGLVSLGYGGDEQFGLDLATGANDLRFFVRNAGGTLYSALSSFVPGNGYWHHVVGVCDEANGFIYLYADGQLIASSAVPAGSGVSTSSQSLAIGSRQSGFGTAYNDQLAGYMDDVSLYNYALSSNTVLAHYLAAGIAPFNLQALPAILTTNQNDSATFTATVTGIAPLSYFWTDDNNNNAVVSTNAVLTLNSVQASDGYQLLVSNAYGTASTSVTLNVNTGPVSIVTQPSPLIIQVPPGYPVSLAVGVGGTAPFNYQWYMNTSTLIAGATSPIYNFVASVGTNTYILWVTNQSGGTQTASSSTVTVEVGAVPPGIGLGDGSSWLANGASFNSGPPESLELTDGSIDENRSAFYTVPQYIEGFLASFTYTPSAGGTAALADGATFTLQNSSSGLNAVGIDGAGLGYDGITPSVAFELDFFSGDAGGTGINWETNGLTAGESGLPNGGTGSVNIASLDPIAVTLFYNHGTGQLDVDLLDKTTSASYRTNYQVGDLGVLLGSDLAYVGFTGGTGGSDSVQTVTNFNYSYSQTPTLSIAHSGGNVVMSWPGPTIPGNFLLQQSSAVNGPWSNVGTATNFPTVGNDQYQVTVAPAGNATFYRLVLPNP